MYLEIPLAVRLKRVRISFFLKVRDHVPDGGMRYVYHLLLYVQNGLGDEIPFCGIVIILAGNRVQFPDLQEQVDSTFKI